MPKVTALKWIKTLQTYVLFKSIKQLHDVGFRVNSNLCTLMLLLQTFNNKNIKLYIPKVIHFDPSKKGKNIIKLSL